MPLDGIIRWQKISLPAACRLQICSGVERNNILSISSFPLIFSNTYVSLLRFTFSALFLPSISHLFTILFQLLHPFTLHIFHTTLHFRCLSSLSHTNPTPIVIVWRSRQAVTVSPSSWLPQQKPIVAAREPQYSHAVCHFALHHNRNRPNSLPLATNTPFVTRLHNLSPRLHRVSYT